MAKINPYGPFSGVREAISLLSLLDDKEKRAEIRKVISEWEDERVKFNETAEEYKIAGEIHKELALAKKQRKETEAWAENIRNQLSEDRKDFDAQKNNHSNMVKEVQIKLDQKKEKLKVEVESANDQIRKIEAELSEKSHELALLQESIEEREKKLAEKEARYNAIAAAIDKATVREQ